MQNLCFLVVKGSPGRRQIFIFAVAINSAPIKFSPEFEWFSGGRRREECARSRSFMQIFLGSNLILFYEVIQSILLYNMSKVFFNKEMKIKLIRILYTEQSNFAPRECLKEMKNLYFSLSTL